MKMNVEETCKELKGLLREATQREPADALLLSGGIDTSAIAVASSKDLQDIYAFTVVLGDSCPDLPYARRVAELFGYKHQILNISEEEALQRVPEVIKILNTFDPAIPNDLAIYLALREVKELGLKNALTGDGSDELFAGYSFMYELEPSDLRNYIEKLSVSMDFSSNKLGRYMGIGIRQPFLSEEVVKFALDLDTGLKVKSVKGKIYGKWILRKAFENDISGLFLRDKDPIEVGSGMSGLRETISSQISDGEFKEKRRDYGISFMNKEHLYFYEVYREVVGEVTEAEEGTNACPLCGSRVSSEGVHCYICGYSPPLRKGEI